MGAGFFPLTFTGSGVESAILEMALSRKLPKGIVGRSTQAATMARLNSKTHEKSGTGDRSVVMCDVMPSIRLDGTAASPIQRSRRRNVTSSVGEWADSGVRERAIVGFSPFFAGWIADARSPPLAVVGFGCSWT